MKIRRLRSNSHSKPANLELEDKLVKEMQDRLRIELIVDDDQVLEASQLLAFPELPEAEVSPRYKEEKEETKVVAAKAEPAAAQNSEPAAIFA